VSGWNYERPDGPLHIYGRTESSSTDENASVGLGVASDSYWKYASPYYQDYVKLNMTATANSRTGIAYTSESEFYRWYPENELYWAVNRTNLGDDVIVPVDIPQNEGSFICRFYGGHGSAEYKTVYICSNGFLSFDNSTEPSRIPQMFPDSEKPNGVIAACWTDLNMDSQSSLITGIYLWDSVLYFVVIWKYALIVANQQRATFEIIIKNWPPEMPAKSRLSQNEIWISFDEVPNNSGVFVYGIEDQQGARGDGFLCSGPINDYTRHFYQASDSFYLKKFTLEFFDANQDTEFSVDRRWDYLRGYNIEWSETNPDEPDGNLMWENAIAGDATLLISALSYVVPGGQIIQAGLFMIDVLSVGIDNAQALAYNQRSSRQMIINDGSGAGRDATISAFTLPEHVDASISLVVDWILKTPSDSGSHQLTVLATMDYDEYSISDAHITPRSVTTWTTLEIGPDDNNSTDKAYILEDGITSNNLYIGGYDQVDCYNISVPDGRAIRIEAQATPHGEGDNYPNFYLSLHDPSGNQVASSGLGPHQNISYVIDSGGQWTIEVNSADHLGFYNLTATTYGIGDGNRDGTVDIFDIVAVALSFGLNSPPAPWKADLFKPDGVIDIFDIAPIATHFGNNYDYGQGLRSMLHQGRREMLLGGSTTVTISPSQTTLYKHQTFSVNVTLAEVTDLYGWEFKVCWDNSILNLTSAQTFTPETWCQNTFEAGDGIQNNFSETQGRYWKAMSALNPALPFNGNMTLVTLTFEALKAGTTTLSLQDTKLSDSEASAINHTDCDGSVTVMPLPLYMRTDQHTVNNATMYKLMDTHTQTASSTSKSTSDPENEAVCYWGIRVWKRLANGTEVELTSGSPVAVVSRSTSGQGLQNATWSCPGTSLNPTDSLVVRVYYKFDSGAYALSSQFSTVQLNATSLVGQTWTVCYYTSRSYNSQQHKTYMYYKWDNTYLSRIENLNYG